MARNAHLSLFGIPELRDAGGSPIPFRTRKQLALVVYLVLEARQRPVSRDHLVELLWPDVAEARARHSLSQALMAIRKALGEDSIRKVRDNIQFVGNVESDMDHSEWGDADLAHPLYAFDDCAGTEWSQWVDGIRERCRNLTRGRLAKDIEHERLSGDGRSVHERALKLYSIDPLSELAAQVLTETMLLDGDRTGAAEFVKTHRSRVESTLGRVSRLSLETVLRNLDRRPKAEDAAHPVSKHFSRNPAFIGRDVELQQLRRLWGESISGGSRSVLVTGAPGIGKSSLLRRFASMIGASGSKTVVLTCQEIGAGIPYASLAELFGELARDPSLSGTDPMWLAEASRIYPALRGMYAGIREPGEVPGDFVRVRLAEALYRMIEVLSEKDRLLVAIDDTQHMDEPSRDVITLAVQRLSHHPVMVLACFRNARAGFTPSGLDRQVAWTATVNLPALTRQEIQAKIEVEAAELGGTPQLRDEIVSLAEGNPYLAEILVADWRQLGSESFVGSDRNSDGHEQRLPRTMNAAFSKQFSGLSREVQQLLDVLAVAGRGMDLDQLTDLWGAREGLAQVLVDAADTGALRLDQQRLSFKNELHRAHVYARMGHDVRILRHRQVAESLEKRVGNREDFQVSFEVAHHYLAAGSFSEAASRIARGASRAIIRGAPREAETQLRILRSRAPATFTPELTLLLAQSLDAQGKHADVFATLTSTPEGHRDLRSRAAEMSLIAHSLRLGRLADSRTIARSAVRAVAAARSCGDSVVLVRALQILAETAAEYGDTKYLAWAARQSSRTASVAADPGTRSLADLTRGYALLEAGEFDNAERAFKTCAASFRNLGMETELRRALNGHGMAAWGKGAAENAIASYEEAIKLTERVGDSLLLAVIALNEMGVYQELGLFSSAVQRLKLALSLLESHDGGRARAFLFGPAADLSMVLGDLEQAHQYAERATFEARKAGVLSAEVNSLLLRAEVFLALMDEDNAWPLVEQAVQIAGKTRFPMGEISGLARLRRHRALATGGIQAFRQVASEGLGEIARKSEYLEALAFEQSVLHAHGYSAGSSALDEIVSRKLFGIIAKLATLNTPLNFYSRLPGEAGAVFVVRVFPEARLQYPPTAIGGESHNR